VPLTTPLYIEVNQLRDAITTRCEIMSEMF
jgi:hypothetical protein